MRREVELGRRIARRLYACRGVSARRAVHIPLASLGLAEVHERHHREAPFNLRPQVVIAGEGVPGLVTHAYTSLVWRLAVPRRARLRTHVGILEEAWEENEGGVVFTVEACSLGGTPLRTVARHIDPALDRAWRQVELDLSGLPTREILLRLNTTVPEGACDTAAWAVWGNPELLAGSGRRARGQQPRAGTPSPLFTIVMPVHDPNPGHLERAIRSVLRQTYDRWELCIADDGSEDPMIADVLSAYAALDDRVRVSRGAQAGISAATNRAIELGTGEFVAFLDHDDELDPGVLAAVVDAVGKRPGADLLYTDADHISGAAVAFEPFFKPDWSPELLESCLYLGHLRVIRRSVIDAVGGARPEFDGAQDFDLALRATEQTDRVEHIPIIGGHWRVHRGSASSGDDAKPWAYEAGERALGERLRRSGRAETAEHVGGGLFRLVFPGAGPLSVVVSLADAELDGSEPEARLATTLDGLARVAGGAQTLVTGHPDLLAICARPIKRHGATPLPVPARTPRAAALNNAAARASGDVILGVLELGEPADVHGEPAGESWADTLAGLARRDDLVAAGPSLVGVPQRSGYTEHGARFDRAGIVLVDGMPTGGHAHVPVAARSLRLRVTSNVLAVDGVFATRRSAFQRLGGLSASFDGLEVVDYCLRGVASGGRVVHVAETRWRELPAGPPRREAIPARLAFRRRWGARFGTDPYYHPELRQDVADFTPADPARWELRPVDDRRAADDRPPRGGVHALRRALAAELLSGRGIEVAARDAAVELPAGAVAAYVDRLPTVLLRREHPELPVVAVDVVDRDGRLEAFADASQDFVIAGRLLTEAEDPLRAVTDLLRVVRPGGLVMLAAPREDAVAALKRNRLESPICFELAKVKPGPDETLVVLRRLAD